MTCTFQAFLNQRLTRINKNMGKKKQKKQNNSRRKQECDSQVHTSRLDELREIGPSIFIAACNVLTTQL